MLHTFGALHTFQRQSRRGRNCGMTERSEDIDDRSRLFVNMTTEALAAVARNWPRPVHATADVQALLAQARRLFVGAASCYDNLAQAELVALQATEAALRDILRDTARPKATLGELVRLEQAERALTRKQLLWFREFGVRWRNRLAHPGTPVSVTPGMAVEVLDGVHRLVAELYPNDRL